jgi:hypothetical protein
MVEQCADSGAQTITFDWDEVIQECDMLVQIWTEALRHCDVAICTVHPPREGFHCAAFAARCMKKANLQTFLLPKTGTIVPQYE